MNKDKISKEARMRLVETGGRTSQDLGAGRIVGQVLVYLYLQEDACSLDRIGDELGLSKASVSIAARQLEQLGLARKVWKSGDRKNYYRSADNIANALQNGLLLIISQKIKAFGEELNFASNLLEKALGNDEKNREITFLQQRVARASKLQKRLDWMLSNPLINFFTNVEKKD